jgi:hypothetical protein
MKRLTPTMRATWAVMTATAHADGDPALGAQDFKQCAFCHATGPHAMPMVGPPMNGVVGRVWGVGLIIATPPGSSPGIAPAGFGMMLRWIDGWLGHRRWCPAQRWRWTDWMTHNNGKTSLPI